MDRDILYRKLLQLIFPMIFVDFLRGYYHDDFIVCSSAGAPSQRLYLSHGLRQGCNLSAILFILYLSELENRLCHDGVGVEVVDSILA